MLTKKEKAKILKDTIVCSIDVTIEDPEDIIKIAKGQLDEEIRFPGLEDAKAEGSYYAAVSIFVDNDINSHEEPEFFEELKMHIKDQYEVKYSYPQILVLDYEIDLDGDTFSDFMETFKYLGISDDDIKEVWNNAYMGSGAMAGIGEFMDGEDYLKNNNKTITCKDPVLFILDKWAGSGYYKRIKPNPLLKVKIDHDKATSQVDHGEYSLKSLLGY